MDNTQMKIDTTLLSMIKIKLNVPQLGSYRISELEDDILYDFIVDLNGDFKIGKGHYKLNNKLEYLYFAGRMKMKDNKIVYINNDSGHYYPSQDELEIFTIVLQETIFSDNNLISEFIELNYL